MAEESPIPWQCFERMWVIILAFYRPSSGKAITSDDPPNGRTVVEFNKGTLAGPTSISHLFTAGILSAPEPRYNFSFPPGQLKVSRWHGYIASVRPANIFMLFMRGEAGEGPEVANSQRRGGDGFRASAPPSPLTCPLSSARCRRNLPGRCCFTGCCLQCPRRCLGLLLVGAARQGNVLCCSPLLLGGAPRPRPTPQQAGHLNVARRPALEAPTVVSCVPQDAGKQGAPRLRIGQQQWFSFIKSPV